MTTIPDDIQALKASLTARLPDLGGDLKIDNFGKGQSNPTYLIKGKAGMAVLRTQPKGELLRGAHAVDREFRAMSALANTTVPVPQMYYCAGRDDTLDRLYFVMELVPGVTFWDPALPDLTADQRNQVYQEMLRVLSSLHNLNIDKIGLSDYGKPGNYFARQFTTWQRQYRASETDPNPQMETIIEWLADNLPEKQQHTSLVHGDYRIDNLLFDPKTLKVIALLDWELSTTGDPLADIAYQCMQWRLANNGVFKGLAGIDRTSNHIPSEQDYVQQYCQLRNIDSIPNWQFYLVFSFFRLASILQGIYRRYLDGNAANGETALAYANTIPELTQLAIEAINERHR